MHHNSPGNNTLLSTESGLENKLVQMPSHLPRFLSLNLTRADVFANDTGDDASMDDSFTKIIKGDGQTEEPGLEVHDGQTDLFFN